jgi:outer membrane protein
VEIARRGHWPTVNLGAGYGYVKGSFLPSVDSSQAQVGVTVSAPIYEGGRIRAQTRQARAQALASRHSLEALQDQVNLDTESAFLTLQDSAAAARQALESFRSPGSYAQGYDIGDRSIIDLLIRPDYNGAQRNYYPALHPGRRLGSSRPLRGGLSKDLEAITPLKGRGAVELPMN